MALEYLSTYCQTVYGISGRRHLRSADRGHLDFPCVKLLRTEDVHLHTPALHIGTHFMLTLNTIFLSRTPLSRSKGKRSRSPDRFYYLISWLFKSAVDHHLTYLDTNSLHATAQSHLLHGAGAYCGGRTTGGTACLYCYHERVNCLRFA